MFIKVEDLEKFSFLNPQRDEYNEIIEFRNPNGRPRSRFRSFERRNYLNAFAVNARASNHVSAYGN